MSFDRAVADVLSGRPPGGGGPARPEPAQLVEARALAVTPEGVTFTVPGWDGGRHRFGPAPWPKARIEPVADHQHGLSDFAGGHDHVETGPAAGDRLLVAFVWDGRQRVPWVIGWWS